MPTKDATLQLWNAMADVRTAIDRLETVLVTVVEDVAFAQVARRLLPHQPKEISRGQKQAATTVRRPERRNAVAVAPTSKRGAVKRTTGRKAEEATEAILATLGSNGDGLSVRQISDVTRLSPSVVAYRVNVLRNQKKVRMEGMRSTARYFLVA